MYGRDVYLVGPNGELKLSYKEYESYSNLDKKSKNTTTNVSYISACCLRQFSSHEQLAADARAS